MPSVSAAQHRLIGYWHSHPEARPKSMSGAQVDEWLHADKGSPWKADGGPVNPAAKIARMAQLQAQREAAARGDKAPGDPQSSFQQIQQTGGFIPLKSSGGKVQTALRATRPGLAVGGNMDVMRPPIMPYATRQDIREEEAPVSGFINGTTPGRADAKPVSVASGTYVVPADVVAGLGEGNGLAGANLIDRMFSSEPYGIKPAPRGRGHNIPSPPHLPANQQPFAKGGAARSGNGNVPIYISDGEHAIPPDNIAYHPDLGGLDPNDRDPKHYEKALNNGHDVLDAWVKKKRAEHIKHLQKLPGPAK